MRFDVVGFGALNVDRLYRVNRIAREGGESFIFSVCEASGGSAANTVVGLARLGARTGFVGKVGDDREGRLLLDDFKTESVDTNGIVVADEGCSGTVSAFVDKRGERALYVHPSVNDTLVFEEINFEYVSRAGFLHLASMDVRPFRAQRRLVEVLSDVRVSLDPGEIYARMGLVKLRPIVRRCFVVMPSEGEVRLLTGRGWRDGAKRLLREGVAIVAVKLGERGCFVSDGRESFLVPPVKVRVVDATGAGDAWDAGFLFGLVKHKDLYDCARLGNFVASKCIAKVGARSGLPRVDELGARGLV